MNFSITETEKLLRKYDSMPDAYYVDGVGIGPVRFGSVHYMASLGYQPGKSSAIWEWMAGSATLSAHARLRGLSHLPPVDHRWGFHMGRIGDQQKLLYSLLVSGCDVLFAAPTCTPWGGHARSWDAFQRKAQRLAQARTLQFLGAACVIQMILGKTYVIENPHGSDIWSESALSHLRLAGQMTVLDQCQFGAVLEGQPILKATDLLSNVELPQLARRCPGDHVHLHLRGKNAGGARTAQSAVYPQQFCAILLDQVQQVQSDIAASCPTTSAGGRIRIHFDALTDPSNQKESIFEILTELKVHAERKGLLELWDQYVKTWIDQAFYHRQLPVLPNDAEMHLTSSGNGFSEQRVSPPPAGRLCVSRCW